MKNNQNVRGKLLAWTQINPDVTETLLTVLRYTAVFIGGFILATGDIFSTLSPFGAAFALAVGFTYMPAATGGAILGYIISESSDQSVKYIAAVILGAVILFTFWKVTGKKLKQTVTALIAGGCIAAAGITAVLGSGGGAYEIILEAAEGIAGGCFCYFVREARRSGIGLWERRVMKTAELLSIMVTISAFVLSLSIFTVAGVSPARIIATVLVLICAVYGHETAGAVAGVSFGAVLGFADGTGLLAASLPLGGLAAGLAGRINRFFAAIAFILGTSVIYLFTGSTDKLLSAVIEAGAAALVIVLLPNRASDFLSSYFISPGYSTESESMKELLTYKLMAASATVSEVSDSVKAVSLALRKLERKNENSLYTDVREQVCETCERKKNCWEYNFESTLDAFNRMTMRRKNGESATKEALPSYFASRCTQLDALTDNFNNCYTLREYRKAAETQLAETRSVAADQFVSISVMLRNLADELQRDIVFSPETAEKARAAAEDLGISVCDAICTVNEGGYMNLQMYCYPADRKISAAALADAISAGTGVEFDTPVIDSGDNEKLLLLFCEKPPCVIKASASQFVGSGQAVCGDAYDFFNDGRGHFIMILSDGMGTGSRAAVDGAMTTGLAGKLIRAGFSFEAAVKTVNSALMVKSKEESLATLDIVSVDLFKGEATFYKAGAAASLISRHGKMIRIERSSMPLGILRDIEFERVTGRLGDGDVILMMSDGAAEIPPDALRKKLSELSGSRADAIASEIAALAQAESPVGKADDITVIAAEIRRKK
ncbi:MAG: SpoIIE family protein phosphatase [Clostridia bacterium]|nr:SpoIIE family protein phosphatase [Clostridia bacterium]